MCRRKAKQCWNLPSNIADHVSPVTAVRKVFFAGLACVLGHLTVASAQTTEIVSDAPDDMSVTIYPDNLAMITEVREVVLPVGRSRIVLRGVNDRMIPETALLTEFGAVTIERNFDYDLLGKAQLLESAVGEEVTLYRTLPGSGEVQVQRAKILAGETGAVLETEDGIEAFQCSLLSESVQFDGQPSELQAEPSLSLIVDAAEAGPQKFEFRYLASGFRWRADYVLNLQGKKRGSLLAWLTATNSTGVGIHDADVSIVAGKVARLLKTDAPEIEAPAFVAQCLPPERPQGVSLNGILGRIRQESIIVTASRVQNFAGEADVIAERENLGDYKLYRVPFRTSLTAQQTKQLLFIDKPRVKVTKRYAFDYSDMYDREDLYEEESGTVFHATERYEIDNSRKGHLSEPLPSGVVRVMMDRDNGVPFYIGNDDLENTAIGQPAIIDATYSGRVAMTSERVNEEKVRRQGRWHLSAYDQQHEFINATDETVEIEFQFSLDPNEILSKATTRPKEEKPVAIWRFSLAKNSSRSLSFHIDVN